VKDKYAFFDFDGTLTTKDTMFDFLASTFGTNRLLMGLSVSLPSILLFKLKLGSRQKAKEQLLHHFFKTVTEVELNEYCERYANRVDMLVRPEAMTKLRWHLDSGHKVFIVSASIENWILPWAKRNGIDGVIATQLDINADGQIKPIFKSKNCYGAEKVGRIVEQIPNITNAECYAYGDSSGDKELLAFAKHSFFRKFM
jgi:phosphatidylglycerophosphatase C